jgi:hypothetical protein
MMFPEAVLHNVLWLNIQHMEIELTLNVLKTVVDNNIEIRQQCNVFISAQTLILKIIQLGIA